MPVIPKAKRASIINASITTSYYWDCLEQLTLTKNLRLQNNNHPDLLQYIKDIGENKEKNFLFDGTDEFVKLPNQWCIKGENIQDLIDNVYCPNILSKQNIDANYFQDKCILTPKNEYCHLLNSTILNKMNGPQIDYLAIDTIGDDYSKTLYTTEFLSTLMPSNCPPYKLSLKINAPIILIRNLSTSEGLCNGTRLIVKDLKPHLIIATPVNGKSKGQTIFLPKIVTSSDKKQYGFEFNRFQFPVRLCMAMTINKSQGQGFNTVGIYLPEPVFGHGQLYVALSRCKYLDSIFIMIADEYQQDECYFTKNIVYNELLKKLNKTK